MNIRFARAKADDIDELLSLYFLVYGRTYPLAVGTNPNVMKATIINPAHIWIVARDEEKRCIVASIVCESDVFHKIGRVQAMAVHPKYRGLGLASRMIEEIVRETLGQSGRLNSIYATTRTVSISAQAAFLNQGFLPLGIFPNAHCLKNYETLTLMARFRDGVLEKRNQVREAPEKLLPIIRAFNFVNHMPLVDLSISDATRVKRGTDVYEFEFIHAPDFVMRRFNATFADPYDRFYPFHEPNLLLSAKNGGPEFYAHYNGNDGYCTIVGGSHSMWEMAASLEGLISSVFDFGVSYIEILMALEHTDSLAVLLENQFLPSALYPAMQGSRDFVLLSRSAEPLNFRGVAIHRGFKPYIDQLIQLWKEMHVDVMEVVDEIG